MRDAHERHVRLQAVFEAALSHAPSLRDAYLDCALSVAELADQVLARIRGWDDPALWISRPTEDAVRARARELDAQVAAKVDEERSRIAAAEAQKAKRLVAIDVDAKVKEIADLNQVLRQRDGKLAEAQQAHADLIRKQRERQRDRDLGYRFD